jgi:hypothetical protein
MLTSVSNDRAFAAAALLSGQVRQLRGLISQSDQQLDLIKTARKHPPLDCSQLAGDASAAAGLGLQQGPLLQAIPGELRALPGEIVPAAARVAALQSKVVQLAAQLKGATDATASSEITDYQTSANALSESLTNAQLSLKTIPAELDRFTKQYDAAVSAPIEVANLCRPHRKGGVA